MCFAVWFFFFLLSSCLVKAPKITYFLSWICSRHTVVWKPKFRQTEQCAHEPDAAKLAHCNVALGSRPRQLHAPCVASIPRDAQAKNFQWIDWTKCSHLIAFVFFLSFSLAHVPLTVLLRMGKYRQSLVPAPFSYTQQTTGNHGDWSCRDRRCLQRPRHMRTPARVACQETCIIAYSDKFGSLGGGLSHVEPPFVLEPRIKGFVLLIDGEFSNVC